MAKLLPDSQQLGTATVEGTKYIMWMVREGYLAELIATGIMSLPNGGGASWNEAHVIGERVASVLGKSDAQGPTIDHLPRTRGTIVND